MSETPAPASNSVEHQETKRSSPVLYGAYVITRRFSGYKTWTFGDDVPMLVGLMTSQSAALELAKLKAKETVDMASFIDKSRPCRTGYCAKLVPVDETVKQIEWNDC